MAMTPTIAREHIADSADCITESIGSIKRVLKAYPSLSTQLKANVENLTKIKTELQQIEIVEQ